MTSHHLSKISFYLIAIISLITITSANAQTVQVGAGSYSTTLPSGEIGPQNFNGVNIQPKVSNDFDQRIQSNDYWSSLIFPFYAVPHSNVMYAHPINAKAVAGGLEIGYSTDVVFAARDYLYPFSKQLTVGVAGLNASQALTDSYGDWTVTSLWKNGLVSMKATLGHGLPYVFFEIEGGNAQILTEGSSNIWFNQGEVLGITINNKHYGIFAPTGSSWSGTSNLTSSLNGEGFLSVAVLPDNSTETLELFRKHAYAFVVDSRIDWEYNENTADVTTTYTYETVLKDSVEGNLNETMTALYRHQWLHSSDELTDYTYISPRGTMKLIEGSTFTTDLKFSGVLPALPNRGDYNPDDLLAFVQEAASQPLPITDTYNNGKAMARFTNLVHIADQIGATSERDYFLSQMKLRLEDWFTAGGDQEYVYLANWDVMTGYPSGFGADNQINDHHFHHAYAIATAATIAQYDSVWASQDNWGAMVNMLIRDANGWDRNDDMFPFLRSHDSYAGHSWAAGHGDFGDGNNQESSSESMNFASSVVLWGEATNQEEIRDLGVFLYSNEASAIEQYWFDVDDAVFPDDYPRVAIGMVWGGKGVYSTWFGADPEFIHGINILPLTSGSLYLGHHPDYIKTNYDAIVTERGSQPVIWKDVLWQYLAMSDPNQAISYYLADPNYEPFDGESRAHTLHWLFNMKKMGHVDTTIHANIPTYAVFQKGGVDKTYIAYNAGSAPREVLFSDGFSMMVQPKELASSSTANDNPNAPVALLLADKTSGKAPLTVQFEANKSFDRNESELSYFWEIDELATTTAVDTSFVFTEEGDYWVRLTVTNELGLSTSDSVLIQAFGNGTPHLGNPIPVPGRIEAEYFDDGGEGIAYHDNEPQNIGLAYRPDEGVDMEAIAGGFAVYWIVAGEWIEYTFQVQEAGTYTFTPHAASVPGFGNFRVLIDNEDISGKVGVGNTGGWQFYNPFDGGEVELEPGTHRLRLEFDSDTDKSGWLFSLNYIDVGFSVSKEEEADIPTEINLEQNYPNPFNPSTSISYSIPDAGMVTLEVSNILGQRVSLLVNERQTQGRYTANFDASTLSSGLYFYTLSVGSERITKKMMLIK